MVVRIPFLVWRARFEGGILGSRGLEAAELAGRFPDGLGGGCGSGEP